MEKRLILYLLLNNRSRFVIFRLLVFNELVYLGYLPEYSFRGFIYLLKLIPFFLEFGKIFLCIDVYKRQLYEGEIVERGKHEELIELNGYYKRLHDMQQL